MKNGKISLRVWVFLKISPAVLLVFMWWMNMREASHPLHIVAAIVVFAVIAVFSYFDRKTDIFDELAKEGLRRADSICLKTAYAMGLIAISLVLFFGLPNTSLELSVKVIGYGIVFIILFLTILRAFAFLVIDKRGI